MSRCYYLTLVAGAFFLPAAGRAFAQAPPCPVWMEISLTASRIVVGQPIILTYKLTNSAQQFVWLDRGSDMISWLHLSVVDSAGRPLPPVPDYTVPRASTFRLGPGPGLGAGATSEDQVVISRYFQIQRAGTYRVRVDGTAPCRFDESFPTQPLRVRAAVPLTVSASSMSVLRRTADQLVQQIAERRIKYDLAIQQLMSMPEQYALPIAQRFVFGPRSGDPRWGYFVQELERIGSPNAQILLRQANIQENDVRRQQGLHAIEDALGIQFNDRR